MDPQEAVIKKSMMEPDAPSPSAPVSPPPTDFQGGWYCATCGAEGSEDRACCPQDPQVALEVFVRSSATEDESSSANEAFSNGEDEDDELHSERSREHEESDKSDGSSASGSVQETAPGQQEPGHDA